ncbi:MAG: hypothetical protein ACK4PR_01295 [Gammaproteobacteria bacterium]
MSNLMNLNARLANLSRQLSAAKANGDEDLISQLEDEIDDIEYQIEQIEYEDYDSKHGSDWL